MAVSEQARAASPPSVVCVPPIPEPVNLTIDGKKLAATMSEISLTGGVLQIPEAVARRGFGSITIKTPFGMVSAPIEFLQFSVPGKRNAVAFRFFHVDPVHQDRLEQALNQMCKKGFGKNQKQSWSQKLVRLIRG